MPLLPESNWHTTRDEILVHIPKGTFVATTKGRVGLLVGFSCMQARVQFTNNGRLVGYTILRPATKEEVEQAGLEGVGGWTAEDLAPKGMPHPPIG